MPFRGRCPPEPGPGLEVRGYTYRAVDATDARDTHKNYKVSLLTTLPSSSYRNDAALSSSDVSPSS